MKNERYSLREMEHIAVNYAISCQKGYSGTFRQYMGGVRKDRRKWLKEMDKSMLNSKEAEKDSLTDEEKQAIEVLNFIATFDGIIQSEDEIKYILKQGIEKFIPKKRRHLVYITETTYPIKITY